MKDFAKWLEGFLKACTFQDGFHGFHVFDLAFLLFLALGVLYGYKRGFLRMLVEWLEFLVVVFLTLDNYAWIGQWIMRSSQQVAIPERLALTVSFFLIFSLVWAAVMIIDQTLKKWVATKTHPVLRAVGGMGFGLVYFFLLFSLVCKGLSLVPSEPLHKIFISGNSRFGPSLATATEELYKLVTFKLGALFSAG